jgi:rSAM/selenodomain-associated transferase 2
LKLSIIIPTLNEASCIGRLLERLLTVDQESIDIIIVDGGSTDETIKIAKDYNVRIIESPPSRAVQQNLGAKHAKYDTLYFVHADTLPPRSYLKDAQENLLKHPAATYRSKFEYGPFLLRINAFFTRFYWLVARGGDQSLFIRKDTFYAYGAFDENAEIMEEYYLLEKLMKNKELKLIPKPILISTRKYENRSWWQVSRANYKAFKLFKNGASTDKIKRTYRDALKKS